MSKIFVTERIPEIGPQLLRDAGYEVVVSQKNGVLTHEELVAALEREKPDAVLSLLTNKIDGAVMDAAPQAKIFANFAVGFDNVDLPAAKERGVAVTNTPGVLTDTVAEYTVALIFAVTKRVVEGDLYMRGGKYQGWGPMLLLGTDLRGATLGLLGAGRIGSRVAETLGKGVGMHVVYYDVKRSLEFEATTGATFRESVEEVMREADVVSVHVPLLDSTHHLINAERLAMMKQSAYLINTSRGPVVDEAALADALRAGTIRGAAIDVYEHEPQATAGLVELPNVIMTPHIASATEGTRGKMAEMAAQNIIAFLKGETPPNLVKG